MKSNFFKLFGVGLVTVLFVGGLLFAGCGNGEADTEDEEWPQQEIRVIVNFDEGGGTDTSARQLQPYLEEELGVPLVIENQGGGNTTIGTAMVADADPDGYTIGIHGAPHFEFGLHTIDVPYEYEDFAFPGMHVYDPGMIRIHENVDYIDDFADFVEYGIENPDELEGSVSATTSSNFLGIKMIEEATGAEFNTVAFDGGNPARTALAGEHVCFTHANVYNSLHIEDNTEVIAVHYDENNWPELTDDAPTVNEVLMEEGYITEDEKVGTTGSYYFMITRSEFKEEYPERWETLVEAYENAVTNEEFLEEMEEIGEKGKWIFNDPEESQEYFDESMETVEQYLELVQ